MDGVIGMFNFKFWQSKKKPDPNQDILLELHNINKSLNKLCDCIDHNGRYGGAIKTTHAPRY